MFAQLTWGVSIGNRNPVGQQIGAAMAQGAGARMASDFLLGERYLTGC